MAEMEAMMFERDGYTYEAEATETGFVLYVKRGDMPPHGKKVFFSESDLVEAMGKIAPLSEWNDCDIDEEAEEIKAICEAAADCRVDDAVWCATVDQVEPWLKKFRSLPHTERVRIGKLLKDVPIFGNDFAEDINGAIFAEV
jgi:hypothetical protein